MERSGSFAQIREPLRNISDDGRLGFTGGDGSGFLKMWQANNTVQLREFTRGVAVSDYIDELDISNDGRFLLVHSENRDYNDQRSSYWVRGRYVAVWEIGSGEELVRFDDGQLDANGWDVTAVAFSNNGELALTGGTIGPVTTITLWDATTGESLRQFTGHTDTITEVGFHPDDLYAYSQSRDGTTRIWDILSLEDNTIDRFNILGDSLGTVGLSPDIEELYASYDTRNMGIWSVENGQAIFGSQFRTNTQNVIAYNPQQPMAFVATDNSAEIWDISSGTYIYQFPEITQPSRIQEAQFSPDGSLLLIATGSNTTIYNVETLEVQHTINTGMRHADFSGNNEFVAYSNGSNIARYDLVRDTQICQTGGLEGGVKDIAFNPGFNRIVVALGTPANKLVMFNARNCQQLFDMLSHIAGVNSVDYGVSDFLVISGGDDNRVILWDALTGLPLQTFFGHEAPVQQVIFGLDGRTAISVSSEIEDGVLKWNIRNTSDTIDWVRQNRYLVDLTCTQRDQYKVEPVCDNGVVPEVSTSTPFPTLTPIPTSTLRPTVTPSNTPVPVSTVCGENGAAVRLRTGAGSGFAIIQSVESGTSVVIIEERPDINWANIRLPDGTEGWIALFVLEPGNGC